MMHLLRKFLSLKLSEQYLLFQAFCALPLTTLGVRLFGLRRVMTGLHRLAGLSCQQAAESKADSVRRTLIRMRRAARYAPYKGNCLSQSLALWYLLHCQGILADLRIGTRNHADGFEAHAWVEYQGRPLNEGGGVHERYSAFDQTIPMAE